MLKNIMIKGIFKLFSAPEILETHRLADGRDNGGFDGWRAVKKWNGWQVQRCVYVPIDRAAGVAERQRINYEPGFVEVQISDKASAKCRLFIDRSFPTSRERMDKKQAIEFLSQREAQDKVCEFWERYGGSLLTPPRHYSHENMTAFETPKVQTEWITELVNERIEKNASGHWDGYVSAFREGSEQGKNWSCRFKSISTSRALKNVSKDEAFKWIWEVQMERLRNAEGKAAFLAERKKFFTGPGSQNTAG